MYLEHKCRTKNKTLPIKLSLELHDRLHLKAVLFRNSFYVSMDFLIEDKYNHTHQERRIAKAVY